MIRWKMKITLNCSMYLSANESVFSSTIEIIFLWKLNKTMKENNINRERERRMQIKVDEGWSKFVENSLFRLCFRV